MAVNSVPSRSKFHPTVNYESGACAMNSDTLPPPRNLVSRIAADRDSSRDASSMNREYPLLLPPFFLPSFLPSFLLWLRTRSKTPPASFKPISTRFLRTIDGEGEGREGKFEKFDVSGHSRSTRELNRSIEEFAEQFGRRRYRCR